MNILTGLAWVKARLWAIGAFLLTTLGLVIRLRYVKQKVENVTEQRDFARAQLRQKIAIDAADAEIESKYSDLKRESDKDLKDGEMPDHIRNRNDF